METMSNLESLTEFANELRNCLPIPVLTKKMMPARDVLALYNIHKRSLPIGTDKVIVIGLLRDEADKEILRLIHKESERRKTNNEMFYYFDIVPVNSTVNEKSIYYNELEVVI